MTLNSAKAMWSMSHPWLGVLCGMAFLLMPVTFLHAQALGWEGETGVFVTPMAYTASAEGQKLHAVTAYHYLHAGTVIGDFHEGSIEVGIGKRAELGYTHEFHAFGSEMGTGGLSPLWQNGFEIFNGKVILVPENYKKNPAVPAISVGFIARSDVRNVGNYEEEKNTAQMGGKTDGDIYVVATKAVTQIAKKMPIILNVGLRGTNAELWGMGGNAPGWEARPFGAVAFAFTGPGKSSVIFASEAAMQPHHPLDFPLLNIPTTLTYCTRIVPSPKHKLNIDFGVAQIAGYVMGGPTGVNLKARVTWGSQISYGF